MSPQPRGTEAAVCRDIADRQQLGIAKYGLTVAENPAQLREWMKHAYEELLDAAVYLKRAMDEMDRKPRDGPSIAPVRNAKDVEWLTVNETSAKFSLGRPMIYRLMAARQIHSVSLREPGKQIGKRLISADSVRAFFDRLAQEQEEQPFIAVGGRKPEGWEEEMAAEADEEA